MSRVLVTVRGVVGELFTEMAIHRFWRETPVALCEFSWATGGPAAANPSSFRWYFMLIV